MSDWNDADRRAIRYVGVWAAFAIGSLILRGIILDFGDGEPGLAILLTILWVGAAIGMITWTRRERRRGKPNK